MACRNAVDAPELVALLLLLLLCKLGLHEYTDQVAPPSFNPANDLRPVVTDGTEDTSSYGTIKQVYTPLIKDTACPPL